MNIVTKVFLCLCIMFLCISCLHQGASGNRLSTPEYIEEIEILPVDSSKSKIIRIDKPINRIRGYYQNVIIRSHWMWYS